MEKVVCKYGSHRVISPSNALPQSAIQVSNSLPIYDNEILIEVDTLNIDSASFIQIKDACSSDLTKMAKMILDIVNDKGKMMNPVTGSGGMLLGTVKEIGKNYSNEKNFQIGDKIASLVSLSLTPLKIEEIIKIFPESDQVKIKGHAIFFESGVLAKIPEDIHETIALAVLDVAGAPAQVQRLVKPKMNVVLIGGGGKAGMLCAATARDILKETGKIIVIEPSETSRKKLELTGLADEILPISACEPLQCMQGVSNALNGEMADLVINCAPVNDTEMSSIMSAKQNGIVYFFSMATSFTKAALGAEGIGSDALLIIGNGYAPDNDKISLDVIRNHPKIKKIFEETYLQNTNGE